MDRAVCWIAGIVFAAVQAGALSAEPARELTVRWQAVEGVKIPIPPRTHPRLYLGTEQVAQLQARLKDPVLQPVVERLRKQGATSAQFKVEWDTLQYLVTRNRTLGRAVVEEGLDLLKTCELPNRQDACRVTGRMMVTGAIVYDWLYDLLTPDEKQAFIAELVRLAKTQECGYPPTRQGSVTGHSSEAMIMRDMLSAGIATYDEFPEMYRLAAGRFFREHLPARNWFYDGHAYHQGDSYGLHRFSWDTIPLFIFDRLGAGNVYNPEQRFVPYLWVYTTRPDGQRLRAGDTFSHSAPRGRPWSEFFGTMLTASAYGDGILLSQYLRQGGVGSNELLFEFLWRETSLQPKPIESLPLSRYFGSPFGWTVARTGWGKDAVIAEMKINEYNFTNHQHLDAGAFQIYYQGALAIDSGLYTGSSGAYGSPHCTNYYWRTIAHNSLLVFDPDETFRRRGDYGNDGGQRLPNGRSEPRTLDVLLAPEDGYRTGQVTAHGFGPDPQTPHYTLLQGDITAAYSKKVRQVTRSFVFFNLRNKQTPAALVVFDHLVSTNPAFRKYWLLHALEEPKVEETSAIVDCTQYGATGRLILDVILPRADNAVLGKVGGPGKEFWVFGRNYANDVEPDRLARSSMEPGAWRLELSPKAAASDDLLLNVMQVTDRNGSARWPVKRIETDSRVGCVMEGPDATWTALFRRDGRRSEQNVKLTLPGRNPCRILVTDLAPGPWRARHEAGREDLTIEVARESGGDQVLVARDGWLVATNGIKPFHQYSLSGAFKGKPRWSYPNCWPGLHASHEAPVPEMPGQVIGATRLLGNFITPQHSDAGPCWVVNGNMGPMYMFTADGLFVATLFQDVRVGKSWKMPVAKRNMRLNDVSPHDENFWPSITQTADGKVYIVDGGRTSLVRVDNLDSIRRLPVRNIRITTDDLKAAREYQTQRELARQKQQGSGTLKVILRGNAPAIDGKMDDWKGADWAVVDKRGVAAWFDSNSKPYDVTAAVCVAGDRLYAAWRTNEKDLLRNSGEMANAPFKTGGALDLMIGADPQADQDRAKPVQGDIRLLVTRVKDKTLTLVYRAVVSRTKNPVPFSSPWRTITIDKVEDVSDQVRLGSFEGGYEISVPLATLGLQPTVGMQIKADVGVLRGDGTRTVQRVYWSNKGTAITSDVPSEAMLMPQLWGRWTFVAEE